jgi:hypothetical protein
MKSSTCRHDKKDVLLFFYGELDERTARDVELRIGLCHSCRDYHSDLVAMETLVPRKPSVEPGPSVMSAIREATSRKLGEHAHTSPVERPATALPRFSLPWFRPSWSRAALALAVAAIVFLAGRWSVGPNGVTVSTAEVGDISDLAYDSDTGKISVRYQTVDANAVEGTIDDARVRALIARALTESENPAAQFRAVKILSDTDAKRIAPDPVFVSALADILRNDSNEGIQLQAVRALRRIHTGAELAPELTDLLMQILDRSENSALRIEALEMLTENELARQDLDRVLSRAARDQNSFIRNKAKNALDDLQGAIPLEEIR